MDVNIETTTPCPRCEARGLTLTNLLVDHNEQDIRTRYLLTCTACGTNFMAVTYVSPAKIFVRGG